MFKGHVNTGVDLVSFAKSPTNYLPLIFADVESKIIKMLKNPDCSWVNFGFDVQSLFYTSNNLENMVPILLENKCLSIANGKIIEKKLSGWNKFFMSIPGIVPALVDCLRTKTVPPSFKHIIQSLIEVGYDVLKLDGVEKICHSISNEHVVHSSHQENAKLLLQCFSNLQQDAVKKYVIIPTLKQLNEIAPVLLQEAKDTAKEFNLNCKYALNLTEVNVNAILSNSSNRELRKEAFVKFEVLAHCGEFNNSNLVKEVIRNNFTDAKKSGHSSVVRKILKENNLEMSEVSKFFNTSETKVYGEYIQIQERLELFAKKQLGIKILRAWDINFVLAKYKREQLKRSGMNNVSFNSEMMWEKMFSHIGSIFNLTLIEDNTEHKIYVNDKVIKVLDDDVLIGSIYINTESRSGKCDINYAFSVNDSYFMCKNVPSQSFISLSLEPGAKFTSISQLVNTFHEFGHAIQVILSHTYTSEKDRVKGTIVFYSGIDTSLDEFPSQWLEEQAFNVNFLDGLILNDKAPLGIEKIQEYLDMKMAFIPIDNWSNYVNAKMDWYMHKNGTLKEDEILNRANEVYRMMGLYCPKQKNVLNSFSHLHTKGCFFVYPFTKNVVSVFNKFYKDLTLKEKGLHLKTIYMNGCRNGLMKSLSEEKNMDIFVCK